MWGPVCGGQGFQKKGSDESFRVMPLVMFLNYNSEIQIIFVLGSYTATRDNGKK